MSIFNECLIHLCDWTWLNVLYIIIRWSNTKIFLSIFNCFWKVFYFEKFQKVQNFYNSIFGDSLAGHASRKVLVPSLLRSSRDSLASESPSHEKHLIASGHFRGLVASGNSSLELPQKVSRLSLKWICQSWKRLRKNFQNFVHRILATHFGDLLVGQLSRENCVFCTNRVKSQIVF